MPTEDLPLGSSVGDYTIVKKLGAGGAGQVYSAEHELLRRRAAIKVLRGDLATSAVMVERFIREARAASLVRHPNIADVFEIGVLPDGRPWFAMELLDGEDLSALIARRGRFSPSEVVDLVTPVASALDAAHAAGVIHRDLKASNVMVLDPDGKREVRLVDFGIAKLLTLEPGEAQLSTVSLRLGTPHAMAPEQIRSEAVDARTDVYAFGVLLYQLLTGRPPFVSSDALEVERMHLSAEPLPPSAIVPVPSAVEAVVLRCLAKPKASRFEGPGAVVTALRAALDTKTAPAGEVAIAIYVEARTEEAMDDDAFDAIVSALADAADRARAHGFSIALETSSALLAVSLDAAPTAALDLARAVRADLALAGVGANVALHRDRVSVRRGASVEIAGGALTRIATWVPREPLSAIGVTKALISDIGHETDVVEV